MFVIIHFPSNVTDTPKNTTRGHRLGYLKLASKIHNKILPLLTKLKTFFYKINNIITRHSFFTIKNRCAQNFQKKPKAAKCNQVKQGRAEINAYSLFPQNIHKITKAVTNRT